jgi:hypothetical protein
MTSSRSIVSATSWTPGLNLTLTTMAWVAEPVIGLLLVLVRATTQSAPSWPIRPKNDRRI